jgi:predicted NBD/HSP70 family sugar kinase
LEQALGKTGQKPRFSLKSREAVCRCGKKGCPEALASGEAIARQAQAGKQMVICTGAGAEYSTANGICRVLSNKFRQRRELPV